MSLGMPRGIVANYAVKRYAVPTWFTIAVNTRGSRAAAGTIREANTG